MLLTFILAYILPMCVVLFCWWNIRLLKILLLAVVPGVNVFYAAVFVVYMVSAYLGFVEGGE